MHGDDVAREVRVLLRPVGAMRTVVAGLLPALVALMPVQPLPPPIPLLAAGTHVQGRPCKRIKVSKTNRNDTIMRGKCGLFQRGRE